jgi:hypothetical protein
MILWTGVVVVNLENLLFPFKTLIEEFCHISAGKFLPLLPHNANALKIRHQLSFEHYLVT